MKLNHSDDHQYARMQHFHQKDQLLSDSLTQSLHSVIAQLLISLSYQSHHFFSV
jgi:hypothetical protein